jgi:molybdopterin synthase catalytic subunit
MRNSGSLSRAVVFSSPTGQIGRWMKNDWVQLLDQPLDAGRAVGFVTDNDAGGIAVFLGTTRADTQESGRSLSALDYEAYPEMALSQMWQLAAHARQRWPIRKLAILHRTGRVDLGEPSVVIAVSTPHRAEAFDACRWIIDTLKADVAIWKKEVWQDGSATWVHPD